MSLIRHLVFLAAVAGQTACAPINFASTGNFPPRLMALAGAEVVVAPTLKPGQRWTYRRIDLWRNEEVERYRQELGFLNSGRWLVHWTILDSDNASRRGSVTGELLDPVSHAFADSRVAGSYAPLRFRMLPGETWASNYRVSDKGKTVDVTQTAVAREWETVRVPAGSFRALRIEHHGRYVANQDGMSWQGRISETLWYAPDAARIVRRDYRDTKGDGGVWDQWREELVELRL